MNMNKELTSNILLNLSIKVSYIIYPTNKIKKIINDGLKNFYSELFTLSNIIYKFPNEYLCP